MSLLHVSSDTDSEIRPYVLYVVKCNITYYNMATGSIGRANKSHAWRAISQHDVVE